MKNSIHEIFSAFADEYIAAFKPPYAHIKAIHHIRSCRTPDLGAAVYGCSCGEKTYVFHSCRDRHCPICQGMNNARWAEKQMTSALPVKYFHVVFTLPHMLNGFVMSHPRESYGALFDAASGAMLKLCADKKHLGAVPGFTAVLHTWGQTMQFHPHLHMIVTAGGLANGGLRFIDISEKDFLVPIRALSKLFRGIFIDTLDRKAALPPDLKSALYATEFSCHLEEPMDRCDNAVMYLARYANRVCISDARIVGFDKTAHTVTFSYKDNKDGGKEKHMTLDVLEFIRRFLLHILPKRFMKIRHYGILQNREKTSRISHCRRLLGGGSARPHSGQPRAPAKPKFFVCPKCGCALPPPSHLGANLLPKSVRLIC